MPAFNRRAFILSATALGATAVWARAAAIVSPQAWKERRDLFTDGVASGDPDSSSVILWTRRAYGDGRTKSVLTVQVAEDEGFSRVVAHARSTIFSASDWTSRVLVGGLKPHTVYWYRFIDMEGNGSRIGRTITAPGIHDAGAVRFAFVSCQSVNEGAQNAYRRIRHLHVHLRPVFDGSLNIKDVEGWANYKDAWGQRLYSLPSDTATAYFAIGTIVYLQRKILGLFCFFWIFLTVGLGRVVLGFHYPSDIVAGLFLGFSLVFLFTNLKAAQVFLMSVMQRYDAHNRIYATFICLFSAEAYSLFPGLREIYLSLIKLLNNHA